jgi:anti-sigma factor NepR-like protein
MNAEENDENDKNDNDKADRPGPMLTEANQRKARGRLGRDVQGKIGQQLRTMYDNVVNEGVPDRFVDMLRRLDEQKSGGDDNNSDKSEKGVN